MTRPGITGKDVERVLLKAGWYLHHTRGYHGYYKHPDFVDRRITLPLHRGEALAAKHIETISRLADLGIEAFGEFV